MKTSKQSRSLERRESKTASRYRYITLEAEVNQVHRKLLSGSKIKFPHLLKIQQFSVSNLAEIDEFQYLLDQIALTSLDPKENFSNEQFVKIFVPNTFLIYYVNRMIGYTTVTFSEQEKVACIAAIGIHHRQRRKGFASELLKFVVEQVLSEGVERIQADVLDINLASLNLFWKLGFEEIDEFYL